MQTTLNSLKFACLIENIDRIHIRTSWLMSKHGLRLKLKQSNAILNTKEGNTPLREF